MALSVPPISLHDVLIIYFGKFYIYHDWKRQRNTFFEVVSTRKLLWAEIGFSHIKVILFYNFFFRVHLNDIVMRGFIRHWTKLLFRILFFLYFRRFNFTLDHYVFVVCINLIRFFDVGIKSILHHILLLKFKLNWPYRSSRQFNWNLTPSRS